jgi:hypothetical protein
VLDGKPSPAREMAFRDSIDLAVEMMRRIDSRWPHRSGSSQPALLPSNESLFNSSSSSYYGWAVKRERIIEYGSAHRLGGTTANPEHLAKLKEGVEVWNQWRREHREAYPDFSEAARTTGTYCSVISRSSRSVIHKLPTYLGCKCPAVAQALGF